ncbi:hypothetical protein F750_1562 [Streptomyces sp. PAMC 26508]|nr:hypothetical protein F750_1562 [Streptomyces sp. PAMC 26508]
MCPWGAAPVRRLGDSYDFVSTDPRRHMDWANDVTESARTPSV